MANIIRLKNGKLLDCRIYEIRSIPDRKNFSEREEDAQKANEAMFFQMLTEIYRYCIPGSAALEILWLNEKTGALNGKVHIFLLFRMFAESEGELNRRMEAVRANVFMHLQSAGFDAAEISYEDIKRSRLLPDCNTVINAVVKEERYIMHERSIIPYYYAEKMSCHSVKDFNALAETLRRTPGGAVSFQLLPDFLTYPEVASLTEMYSALNQIVSGSIPDVGGVYKDQMAVEAFHAYEWFQSNLSQPVFRYNILAMGDTGSCAALTAQVISLLKGDNGSQYHAVNINRERLSVERDLCYYPWNLNKHLIQIYRNRQIMTALQRMPQLKMLYRLPHFIFAQEATAVFRLPIGSSGNSVVPVKEIIQRPQNIDERVLRDDNVKFGRLPGSGAAAPWVGCPLNNLTKHALIAGMPGTGKTTFSVHLLMQMYENNIPFLAVEPTKTEYRAMIDRIPGLQIFTPGKNKISPFVVNPFLPPRGITVEQYVPSLISAFKAAFSMPSPLDTIFQQAVQEAYIKYGWRDYSTIEEPNVRKFGLHEFIIVFKEVIERQRYSAEVKGNLETGGVFRLKELINQNPNIYDSIETVPLEDLLSAPTVLELNAIDNEEQKSILMALLLINICVYTKQNHAGDGKLKNLLLIDEAHVLFKAQVNRESGNGSSAVHSLENMLAEIRSYGTGIVIADQSPTAVGNEVIKNTDVKVIFRLVDGGDRRIIAEATNMTDLMIKHIPKLEVGQAFYSSAILHEPVLLQTPDIREKEGIRLSVSDAEVYERMEYWKEHPKYLIPFSECRYSGKCKSCSMQLRSDASFYAERYIMEYGEKIRDIRSACAYMKALPDWVEKQNIAADEKERLCNCIRIRYLRRIFQEKGFRISPRDYDKILSTFIE